MTLKIIWKDRQTVELRLVENITTIDMLIMSLDFHFDTVLVTSIDKLLKRNRITKVSSLDIILEGFEDESSASSMIVRTVVEALKIK